MENIWYLFSTQSTLAILDNEKQTYSCLAGINFLHCTDSCCGDKHDVEYAFLTDEVCDCNDIALIEDFLNEGFPTKEPEELKKWRLDPDAFTKPNLGKDFFTWTSLL